MVSQLRRLTALSWSVLLFGLIFLVLFVAGVASAGSPIRDIPTTGVQIDEGTRLGVPVEQVESLEPGDSAPVSQADSGNAVLWDQYEHLGVSASTSQNFEPRFDAFDAQVADNFDIPDFHTWSVSGIEVAGALSGGGTIDSVNIFIYEDVSGMVGSPIISDVNRPYISGPEPGDMIIQLSQPVLLTVGGGRPYWISVQANMDLENGGQWFWRNRLGGGSRMAQWRNPGDGFDTNCENWGRRGNCGLSGNLPDQSFLLLGTDLGIVPSPTGTLPTSTRTPSSTNTSTNTPSPTGTVPSPTGTLSVPEPVLTKQVPVTPSDTPTPSNTPTVTPTFTAVPTCGSLWRESETANPANAIFNDVLVLAHDNVWAVGSRQEPELPKRTLIEHWNGTTWEIVPSPSPGYEDVLYGIDGSGPNDIWAVGSYNLTGTSPLLLHWEGNYWSVSNSPALPNGPNVIKDVSVVAPNYAWAVGYANNETLILRWTGAAWSRVASPNANGSNFLNSVAATGANNAWAAGYDSTSHTLLLRWDGSSWSFVQSMSIFPARFFGVAAYNESDAWVVGSFANGSNSVLPLAYHWNGTNWTGVPMPSYPTGYHELLDAAASGPNDAWLVGALYQGLGLALRCTSAGCLEAPVEAPGANYYPLRAVSVASPNTAWSVGETYGDVGMRPLAELYNDPCGTPGATSTPFNTPTFTATSVPGPSCPIAFEDLPANATDFAYAHCATCAGILEAFACGSQSEPCGPGSLPYFRPNTGFSATYGEIARTLSVAAGFSEPTTPVQEFEDVPPGHPYYDYIWRMSERGIMTGVACGGFGEPCVPPTNRPYFRVNSRLADRGEFARYLSDTAGFSEPVSEQLFEDVPPTHPQYAWIQRVGARGLMEGFACGGIGEPCGNDNRPYFRPTLPLHTVTRLEYAETLVKTFLPGCPDTITPAPTNTGTITPTGTRTPTNTTTGTPSPTITAVPGVTCPVAFEDVPAGDPDLLYARCATCSDIMSAAPCGGPGEPCGPNNLPYFRPGTGFEATNKEVARSLAQAAGFSDPTGSQQFQDVPPGHPYYDYIWRMADGGFMIGYPCGNPGEPCGFPELPYFRPNEVMSRAKYAQILSNTAGFFEPTGEQIFEDVPPGSPSYEYIQRLGARGLMPGFPCGGPGEPCGVENRPYFRPAASLTSVSRIDYANIVINTFLPGCPVEPTSTVIPILTETATSTATTPMLTSTSTSLSTTATTTVGTTTATPTMCPVQFEDVLPGSTFFTFVRCLACRGIVSGYPCGGTGEPCGSTSAPYYRPNNNVTRGQIAKIVANSAGFQEPAEGQTFEDVPVGSTFHLFIERLATRGVINGYSCGGAGEPCGEPARPYFRPNGNTTRGQLSKIVCRAFECEGTVSGQTFEDVVPSHTFYVDIEHLYALGAINGYPCGGVGEPCGNSARPYFRPGANVTRGQTAKIVTAVFFPGCDPRW